MLAFVGFWFQVALRATTTCATIDPLLDGLLALADAHGAFREVLLDLRCHTALRLRDTALLESFVSSQRHGEKDIARIVSSVHATARRRVTSLVASPTPPRVPTAPGAATSSGCAMVARHGPTPATTSCCPAAAQPRVHRALASLDGPSTQQRRILPTHQLTKAACLQGNAGREDGGAAACPSSGQGDGWCWSTAKEATVASTSGPDEGVLFDSPRFWSVCS
ncbi:hypothetical protein BDA96_05G118700 [Sorghum bicolor]|uniref:Uncharacterized protein n=1 Tax=Sorghum bicolor TaxID=4558 RepID=A0A921QXF2_SORBI|nr:hypothetical protein BDA96_05G118700 [Sorghum bicolor]